MKNLNKNAIVGIIEERSNYSVRCDTVLKQNDTSKDAFIVVKDDERVGNIFYHDMFEDCKDENEVAMSILDMMKNIQAPKLTFDITVFDECKEHISFHLINKESNQRYIAEKNLVTIDYLDLIITFAVNYELSNGEIGTAKVSKNILKGWNLTVEELYKHVLENSFNYSSTVIKGMSEILFEMCGLQEGDNETEVMYVLTNESRRYGSANILYPETLHTISDFFKRDVYILPSSIHELILVPIEHAVSEDDLNTMVQEVNATQLEPHEILSSHIYKYNYNSNTITY